MDSFVNFFNLILYQPLFNALVVFYRFLPGQDLGIAVIVLTVTIRAILSPLMVKSIKSQKMLSELQPKMKELQQKYKGDKEKQAREMMNLYQKEKINPFGGCLPLLIQLPILIALYRVFREGLDPETMNILYDFIPSPGTVNPFFLGLVNLKESSFIFALLAGLSQFFQSKMLILKGPQKKEKPKEAKNPEKMEQIAQISTIMQKQMLYFFPIFTVFILLKLPSVIALYWMTIALFSVGQQYLIFRPKKIKENAKT